ncbi:MAG: MMPL family transporter [Deltaproteobacteria bacterium]|jgi:predicted RND superfamily exporter protein|nr:MMPL family transporter [Deltaproteobacteria bacterium]MBW2537494.1 MMPL family transporter [Deltaproteobacteria bacterium]
MRHPWRVLGVALVLVTVCAALALRLEVRPGFENLLPESRQSVQELNRVKEYTTGVSTIMVILEGDDTQALRDAADATVEATRAVGLPWVGGAESGVHDALEFLKPRAGLFLTLEQLRQLHDDVEERWRWEVNQETGFLLDEDDYEPPSFDADSLKERFNIDDADTKRYPDGYYQDAEGKTVVVLLRSAIKATDYDTGAECIRRVRAAIESVDLKSYHPSIRYGLAGDLVTGVAAFQIINADLQDVGLTGGLLILGVVLLYYLRIRTLVSMLLTISIGVLCTFGATSILIGHLNLATGFLFTIIAGNGINPGIIFMARYLEARRRGVAGPGAIREAHRETWLPTLTASCAASAAYASLVVTEFRGFRDFGIIGGIGMVLCWICTFAFLPSILTVAERIAPLDMTRKQGLLGRFRAATRGGTRFGVPFAAIVARMPLLVAALGSLAAVGATYATVQYILDDPMEYDLTVMRSDMSERAEEMRLSKTGEDITGFVGIDGMAILVDRPEQVPLLVDALRERRDAAPPHLKPFEDVHTLQDFVPPDQLEKIRLLQAIKKRLVRARERGFVEDDDWQKLEPHLPPADLEPFTIDDLPGGLAHAFSERDGRRGRVVYISPTKTESTDEARYLFRWAEAYQRTELSDGSVVLGSGRAVIYADMWAAVIGDVPKAVIASLLLTLLVVAVAFRAGRAAAAVMASLFVGVTWMTGLLVFAEVKVNFLNFIALPITFGIGVDYAVNVMQRYRREGRGGALTAVRETGGAVVLCSMTTTLGYLALVTSVNLGVRSLGVAAVLGEIACLVAAMLVLPGALVWLDSRWQRRRGPPSSVPSVER